ncbi:MAG: hypothetical protein CL906_00750 [Dehalococcoidia bacterium]|nr:hypothetical protein [Dehalococcoidia bacterium]
MINEKIVNFIKEKNFYIVVTAISIIGFLLRFYGINWDNGLLFHPDERQLLMISSQMNLNNLDPGWYNYGTFPLYLLEFFSLNSEWNIYELRFPGRILSSIFDSSTIIISGLIGRKLYSNITGILASFFYSICVLAIQTSHFFVVDTFLTFFTTLIIFYCIKLNEKLTVKRTIIVGILFGISLTIKISSALILGIILIVIVFNINSSKGRLNDLLKYYILVLFSSFLTFFILNPFSLINYSDFLLASKTQSNMARGLIDFPYTRQYINTTPYIYHLIQLVKTSLGPIAGLIGIFSILFAFRKLEINNHRNLLILFLWFLIYFGFFGAIHTKFLRYMLPIIPIISIFSSYMISYLLSKSRKYKRLYIAMVIILLSGSLHYTFSFMQIYSGDHESINAGKFIDKEFEEGSVLLKEHWDEALKTNKIYITKELNLYDNDSTSKARNLANLLSSSDGIYLTTKRLISTIPRLEERYPLTTNYYRKLFSEDLGYKLIRSNIISPSSLGFTYNSNPFSRIKNIDFNSYEKNDFGINLGWTDESFSAYDHPETFIFKNTKKLSSDEIFNIIIRINHNENYLNSISLKKVNANYGDSYFGFFNSRGSIFSIISWYIILQIMSIISIPLLWLIFKYSKFPFIGSVKIISLILFSFILWICLSFNLFTFSLFNLYFLIFIVFIASFVLFIKNKRKMMIFIYKNKKSFIKYELIFLASFLIFILIRSLNPDLWHPYRGGEKPMELAYLNAILNSRYMPPIDPWFSGGIMNYYYFGFFIFGMIIKLSQISPYIGFNLAVATVFAISFTTLWSLASNISKSKIFLPIVMVSTTLIFGNFQPFIQIFNKIKSGSISRLFEIDYWQPSRVLPQDSLGYEISEFPFFSFLFADLHPHMISIPIMILSLTFLILSFSKIKNNSSQFYISTILFNSLLLGVSWATNTWLIPVQLFLIFSFSLIHFKNWKDLLYTIKAATLYTGAILFIGYLFFLPFHSNFTSPFTGFGANEFHTRIFDFVEIHYLSLTVIFIFIFTVLLPKIRNKFSKNKFYPQIITLLITAILIAIFVETFKVQNDIGRMNTFFKFYLQIWILISISSSFLILQISKSLKKKFKLFFFYPIIGFLFLSGMLFPVLGTINRIQDRFVDTNLTLDGSKFAEKAKYKNNSNSISLKNDLDAINWLKENERKTKNIIEGLSPLYTWGNRFSIYTGFPSVIGWDWHQIQQREYRTSLINERKNDVSEFYSTLDLNQKINILNKYNVELVIVGEQEKVYYPPEGIKFIHNLVENKLLNIIYQNNGTTIYEVRN